MAEALTGTMTQSSTTAKFLYYQCLCYYPSNGLSIGNKEELQNALISYGASSIHLVFPSWSALDEVSNGTDHVKWECITNVLILNEENRTEDNFKLGINGKIYIFSKKYELIMRLDSLIGEAFNKELKWCKVNDPDREQNVLQRWKDFIDYLGRNPPLSTLNKGSQLSTYWLCD